MFDWRCVRTALWARNLDLNLDLNLALNLALGEKRKQTEGFLLQLILTSSLLLLLIDYRPGVRNYIHFDIDILFDIYKYYIDVERYSS